MSAFKSDPLSQIRDLLRGYQPGFAFVKELIQNAEDAKASCIQLHWHRGFTQAETENPLLQGPALIVINDGPFEKTHKAGIETLGLGSKTADSGKIGRFGFGLKAAFHVCEAFIFLESRQLPELRGLLTPWHPTHHLNWDIANDAHEWPLLHGEIAKLAANDCASWFAIWFPLRRNAVLGETAAICQGDQAFHGDFEMGGTCPPSLRCIFQHGAPSIGETLIFLNHVRAVTFDEPDQPRLVVTNNAETRILSSGERYWCQRVIGSGDTVAVWQSKKAWPKVTKRTENGGESQEPDKAAWDTGVAVSVRQTDGSMGRLRLFWSVFLPVGNQAAVDLPLCSLNRDVHIFLHGYFFLNSERTRVLGIEDCFKIASEETQIEICIAWNKALATSSDGLLPLVIPTLANCFEAEGFTTQVIAEIVARLQTCDWFELYQEHICQKQFFGRIYGPNGWSWQKFDADLISLVFPLLEYQENEVEGHVATLLGAATLKRVVLVQKSAMLTAHALNATWNADDLKWFCDAIQRNALAANPGARRYLTKLLSQFDQLAKTNSKLWDDLPIYEVTPICAKLSVVSASDLRGYAEQEHLFTGGDTELKKCFKDACPKVQAWFMVGAFPPGISARHFDAYAAAKLVLEQNELGGIQQRIALITKLLAVAGDESVKSAIRFLIHGSANHRSAVGTIYLRLAGNDSTAKWNNVIQTLLNHRQQSWQLVDTSFAPGINDDQKCTLDLRMCGAESFRKLCGGVNADVAPLPLAPFHDFLLTHLNEGTHSDPDADNKLLRRLVIHQYGENQFTTLDDDVWLAPEATESLPDELAEAWRELCQNAKIVKRSTAPNVVTRQQELFKPNILTHNGIIMLACKQTGPSRFAKLILHYLGPIGNPEKETSTALRTASWLPLKGGGTSTLGNLLWLEGAEKPLEDIARHRSAESLVITRGAINVDFGGHMGAWNTLKSHLIPKGDDALASLAKAFGGNNALHFGLLRLTTPEALATWLKAVEGCETDISPAVPLVRALWPITQGKEDEDKEGAMKRAWTVKVAGVFAKEWSNNLAKRYDTVLKALRVRHTRSKDGLRGVIADAFHDYLSAAVLSGRWDALQHENGFQLLNQNDEWKSLSELVRPCSGIVREYQVHRDAARTLAIPAEQAGEADAAIEVETAENDTDAAVMLAEFGQMLPQLHKRQWGAFVTLLGDDAAIRSLADELSEDTEGFRSGLIIDAEVLGVIGQKHFRCSLIDGETVEMDSLHGGVLNVPIDSEANSFLVPDRNGRLVSWEISGDLHIHRIRLLSANRFITLDAATLQRRLEHSITDVLRYAFDCHPEGVSEFLDKVIEVQERSLGVAQQTILLGAELHLQQLGWRQICSPELEKALRLLDDSKGAEALAREQERLGHVGVTEIKKNRDKAGDLRNQGIQLLEEIFVNNAEVQSRLAKAIEQKIGGQGYQAESVPFELFQNADDALTERGQRDDTPQIFVAEFSDNTVRFAHWGRPINDPAEADDSTAESYRHDLVKMILLNGSDKLFEDVPVTGKFGLGFKSVFLVCQTPRIVSRSLAFEVLGATYPRRLHSEDERPIRQWLESQSPNRRDGTAFELVLRQGRSEMHRSFHKLAKFLPVFARRIREIRIQGCDSAIYRWHPESVHAGNDWELHLGEAGEAGVLLHLRCGEVSWLFGLGADGIKKLPDLPCLWATAPLHASGEVGFAINGPFDPDPGRTELGKGDVAEHRNTELLLQASTGLCDALKWCARRDKVCDTLGLRAVPKESFWKSLWAIFSSLPVSGKDASAKARVSNCVWPKNGDSGYAGAAKGLPILPNGMPGTLSSLTSVEKMIFETSGFLESPSGQELLIAAATWPEWSEMEQGLRMTADQFISSKIAQSLRGHLASDDFKTERIALPFLIRRLSGEENHATAGISEKFGDHLTYDIRTLGSKVQYDWPREEKEALLEFLDSLQFQNEADEWVGSKSLLIGSENGNEALRAAIAPPERRLASDYSDETALKFFRLCRGEMEVSPEELADWIDQSLDKQDDGRIVAALKLFASEDRIAEEVARLMSEVRKSSIIETEQYRSLLIGKQHRIEKLFQIASLQNEREASAPIPLPDPSSPSFPILSMADLLLAWNETEALQRFTLAGQLGALVFPDGKQTARGEQRSCLMAAIDGDSATRRDSLSAWYRLLCLGCSLSIPLGITPLERVQKFWMHELARHRYWEQTIPTDFANVNEDEAERSLDPVFDEIIHAIFKDKNASGEDAHFWRRVFYDFRKMRRLVFSNDFPRYLLKVAAHPETTGNDLVAFLKSGDVPTHLLDAGFEKWAGVIGQSMSGPLLFVMRELRLMGVLADDRFNSACYYMNSPARRIAVRLGWIDPEEQRSYDFESLMDISERVCGAMNKADDEALIDFFDLPLQWYAHKNPR